MTNAAQILLSYGLPGCLLLAVLLLQAGKIVGAIFDAASFLWHLVRKYAVPVWRPSFWFWSVSFAFIVFLFRFNLSDLLQEYEYLKNPVTLNSDYTTDAQKIAVYEAQISRYVTPAQLDTLRRMTAETAAKINSRPVAIYETALLECGLNPFRVRDDKVAAGWIQFTNAGCKGINVTLPQVIDACRRKDLTFILSATDRYLVRRWENAGRPDMRNTIDLYLAVFAPAHIQAAPEKVVYAGFGNPAYDLNSGLDGWYQSDGVIIRKAGAADGKITVWEIFLCLERRKGLILKQGK